MSTKAIILNKQTYLPITNAASLLGKKVRIKEGAKLRYLDVDGSQLREEQAHNKSGIVKFVSNKNIVSLGETGTLGDSDGYFTTALVWYYSADAVVEIGGVIKATLTHMYQRFRSFLMKRS